MLYIILLIFLTACGSNQHASPDTGSISFKLQLSRPTTTSRAAAATSADICTDYGIATINSSVLNSSGATVASVKAYTPFKEVDNTKKMDFYKLTLKKDIQKIRKKIEDIRVEKENRKSRVIKTELHNKKYLGQDVKASK